MAIPEAQLETWSKQGPTPQFTATYDTIRTVLYDTNSPYAQHNFTVFLQGSYKNDSNIYGDSDVDIVIQIEDVYYSDVSNLSEEERTRFNKGWTAASYQLADFKRDVTSWLTKKFGESVKVGSKAIYIAGSGSRRNADVIVAADFRRYQRFLTESSKEYELGICFFVGATRIDNFPKQHSENCTSKHQGTNRWFKPTVRTFKNLRNKMVNDSLIPDEFGPSYFLEGLLYNVPADRFGGSHSANFNDVLNWLVQADRRDFVCANEMFYLLRDGSPVTWTAAKCDRFLSAAVQTRDNWR
jgi:hypothetical protein